MAFRLTTIGSRLSTTLSGPTTGAITILYARRQNVNRLADSCEVEMYGGSQATGLVSTGNGIDFRGYANWAVTITGNVASTLDVWSWRLIVGDGSQIRFYHKADASGGSWTEWTGSPIAQTAHAIASLMFGDNGRSEPFFGDYAGIKAWSAVKTPANMIAEISSRTAIDTSGLILHKLGAGTNLSAALAAGTGVIEPSGTVTMTAEMPETLAESGEEPQPPQAVTISGVADVDLQGTGEPEPGVAPTIITTSLPGGTVGVPYSAQVVVTGDQPISIGISSSLPPGLSITPGGLISGTPHDPGAPGIGYNFSVIANNAYGSDMKNLQILISRAAIPAPVVTSEMLPDPTVGQSYSFTFSASGAGPYTWNIVGIPDGLVQSGPTISGQPTAPGLYNLWVSVSGAGGWSPQQQFPLRIHPPPTIRRVASAWAAPLKRGR